MRLAWEWGVCRRDQLRQVAEWGLSEGGGPSKRRKNTQGRRLCDPPPAPRREPGVDRGSSPADADSDSSAQERRTSESFQWRFVVPRSKGARRLMHHELVYTACQPEDIAGCQQPGRGGGSDTKGVRTRGPRLRSSARGKTHKTRYSPGRKYNEL